MDRQPVASGGNERCSGRFSSASNSAIRSCRYTFVAYNGRIGSINLFFEGFLLPKLLKHPQLGVIQPQLRRFEKEQPKIVATVRAFNRLTMDATRIPSVVSYRALDQTSGIL